MHSRRELILAEVTAHKTTPLMQQYWSLKQEYPDTLLFFQVGDFYELFFDDAKKASAFLGITLTKRGKDRGEDIPLCGVPVHTLDHYLAKLVKGGFCVALCDQLEQAVPGKMVKRGITRVFTPGTLTESTLLDASSPSYILSFVSDQDCWVLLFAELMTAQLYTTSFAAGSIKSLETELGRFFPDEIIVSQDPGAAVFKTLFQKQGYFTSSFAADTGMLLWAEKNFHKTAIEQLKANKALEQALGVLYSYFKKNNAAALQELTTLHFYESTDFMVLDAASLKNLEIIKNNQDGTQANSLFSVLDQTKTAMGCRTLKKWLVRPLVHADTIEQRLEVVGYLKNQILLLQDIQKMLQTVGDLERIVGRIALSRARIEDYLHLVEVLKIFPSLQMMGHATSQFLQMVATQVQGFDHLVTFLSAALNDDSAKSWIIKEGFDERLDRLRELVLSGHDAISRLEKKEQNATGISSLKIRYTAVHGYYIEVTQAHIGSVPAHYRRQQTLVGRERYMCPELQDLQQDIMNARNEIESVEKEVFFTVQQAVRPFITKLRKMAYVLAQLDVLSAFAQIAYERGYVRPTFHGGRDVCVVQGKHPVIAQKLGSSCVPNDITLTDDQSLLIITGPNMGGKSTYLRQTALLSIMAQCGAFIPAISAKLPLFDAVFTRIGASDNVAEGKSTFLVEMEETAHICQYATASSLVILDEVGRGTSTFDGVALAQAIIEHIQMQVRARCLFATHYHELTALAGRIPGIVNYHVASKKIGEEIIFLHTVIPGIAQGSFGLAIAHLAHLPPSVVKRAYEVMHELSQSPLASNTFIPAKQIDLEKEHLKVALQNIEKKLSLLQSIDYDALSPKKAFDILWQIKEEQ